MFCPLGLKIVMFYSTILNVYFDQLKMGLSNTAIL